MASEARNHHTTAFTPALWHIYAPIQCAKVGCRNILPYSTNTEIKVSTMDASYLPKLDVLSSILAIACWSSMENITDTITKRGIDPIDDVAKIIKTSMPSFHSELLWSGDEDEFDPAKALTRLHEFAIDIDTSGKVTSDFVSELCRAIWIQNCRFEQLHAIQTQVDEEEEHLMSLHRAGGKVWYIPKTYSQTSLDDEFVANRYILYIIPLMLSWFNLLVREGKKICSTCNITP
ncbi:hypothetical protein F4805DRAFT_450958 [Annulohypoxylon moriforme]|nr:hypothetical protein F4805DRAFT_450958 [Annulohypoxylon moriforme]